MGGRTSRTVDVVRLTDDSGVGVHDLARRGRHHLRALGGLGVLALAETADRVGIACLRA